MKFGLQPREWAAAFLLAGAVLVAGVLSRDDEPQTGVVARTAPPQADVAPARAQAPADEHRQPLVALLRDHVVRAAPDPEARRTGSVTARRPLTHVRTVLPVLRRTTGRNGGEWVRVRLPGRPNDRRGWISADGTRDRATKWRITVRLKKRLVVVSHDGRVHGRFRAVIGADATPTPRGRFFIEEELHAPKIPGGPWALAVSARSTVIKQFAGGPGQIALHGTQGIPGALGSAVSHGCVRLSPRAITWMAERIRPGAPLVVRS